MARIREFYGVRPRRELAAQVAELPYDVVSSGEARVATIRNRYSFFHVSKPEVDLPEDVYLYDDRVYDTGKRNLEKFIREGVLLKEDTRCLYLYTQIMEGREQSGLVACLHINDYINGRIKKHELTREDKEKDRIRHMDTLNAQVGLVFTFYREEGGAARLYTEALKIDPEYDFTTDDGIRHIFRVIRDKGLIEKFKSILSQKDFYIADGHHRAASAVRVGSERGKQNPSAIDDEYNWFMAAVFPHNQLMILSYNRAVKDLNGNSTEEYLKKVGAKFIIENIDKPIPSERHRICMYLEQRWIMLIPRFPLSTDPIESLDVSILQNELLNPILGIKDPRTDTRIDFIGGIKGIAELERIVDGGEFKVAFSLHPTSVEELMKVADAGGLMPPKSTWFEPKLRSGMVLHLL